MLGFCGFKVLNATVKNSICKITAVAVIFIALMVFEMRGYFMVLLKVCTNLVNSGS